MLRRDKLTPFADFINKDLWRHAIAAQPKLSAEQQQFEQVFRDLKNYIKTGTVLDSGSGADMFGNTYGPFTVDSIPRVNPDTFQLLNDVTDVTFWSPYY